VIGLHRAQIRRVVPVALLAALFASGAARTADLTEVYSQALENDPTFQSAQHTFEAARQRQPEAFSALLPLVSANASGEHVSGRTQYTGTPEVDRSFQGNDWQIQLKQPLFRLDSVWAYDEARASVREAFAQLTLARQDLILRVVKAYFDIAVAERHVVAAQSQLGAMNEQLDAAKRSFKAGVASVTDVDDSTSRSALAEAQTAVAANELEGARASLEAITGSLTTTITVLREDVVLPGPMPDDVQSWVVRATQESPSVAGAQANLKVAEFELSRADAQRLPVVDLVASVGSSYSSGNITDPVNFGTNVHDRQVSIQVAMPLFDGGAMHAQVVEARAKRSKAQADLMIAQRQIALDVRQTYGELISGIAQVRALRAAVKAGESAVKGNKIGYGLGIRINSDVLNAEQQLYGTVHDLDKTCYDVLYASLKLKAATGELTEGDVYAVNRLLQSAP
jgi:outer membrane protein